MKPRNVVLSSILAVYFLGALPLCHAGAQGTLTFSGHIKSKVTTSPQFSIKLYPPKRTDKAILVTATDDSGNFQFTLSAGSYLFEIYLGTDLVYQDIIELKGSMCCEIDLTEDTAKKNCPCPKLNQGLIPRLGRMRSRRP